MMTTSLFTGQRGRGVLRSSRAQSSPKFALRLYERGFYKREGPSLK